jgi:hypothetical protein
MVLKELVMKDSLAQQPEKEAADDPRKAKQKPKPVGPPVVVAKVIGLLVCELETVIDSL